MGRIGTGIGEATAAPLLEDRTGIGGGDMRMGEFCPRGAPAAAEEDARTIEEVRFPLAGAAGAGAAAAAAAS